MVMRVVNDMWHIDEHYRLVKTSNDQPLSDDEPVFIFRGRDRLAVRALELYRKLCLHAGCNDYMISRLDAPIEAFRRFATEHAERMKLPGVTRGK